MNPNSVIHAKSKKEGVSQKQDRNSFPIDQQIWHWRLDSTVYIIIRPVAQGNGLAVENTTTPVGPSAREGNGCARAGLK